MNKKLYKSQYNRVLFGVCGGLANYFNIDATVMRLIWLVLSPAFIIYLIIAIILPTDPHEVYDPGMKRMYRSSHEKMLFGVCGGLAQYLNVDVSFVRIVWVILAFCGTLGLWPYLLMAIIMPER